MFEQDYVMRMIRDMTLVLLAIAGKKVSQSHTSEEQFILELEDKYPLLRELEDMVEAGKINEAENLLFDEIDFSDSDEFTTAVAFYAKLNQIPDDILEKHDFSHAEVLDGLQDCAKRFGVDNAILERFKI